jgi:hypothetical protein
MAKETVKIIKSCIVPCFPKSWRNYTRFVDKKSNKKSSWTGRFFSAIVSEKVSFSFVGV